MVFFPAKLVRNPGSRTSGLAAVAGMLLAGVGQALEIRDTASGTYVWMWGLPTNPTHNSLFQPDASFLNGVGWPDAPYEWHRFLAMVSPVHFLGVQHYPFEETLEIRFLGTDQEVHGYPLVGQQMVYKNGVATDLTVGLLGAPVDPAVGVLSYPVANLATVQDYLNRDVTVIGKAGWAGVTQYTGQGMLTNLPGFETTSYCYFDYSFEPGEPTDIRFENGDSGSPTFLKEEGEWCLMGVHSALVDLPEEDPTGTRSYDIFLPDYFDEIDALMEAQGYHLKRRYPEPTGLTVTLQASGNLVEGQAGAVDVQVTGAGPATAHNVAMTITAPGASSVAGAGWIVEPEVDGSWQVRRGGVAAAVDAPLQVLWSSLSGEVALHLETTYSADGLPEQTTAGEWIVQSAALAAYESWAAGLDQTGVNDDPDADGIANLVEYALGGDASSAASLPRWGISESDGRVWIEFPRRIDAAERGLSYEVEYSEDASIWDDELAAGSSVLVEDFVPARPGFERVRVGIPHDGSGFLRMRIALSP